MTFTLPAAPFDHFTSHLKVAPASDFTSSGHFTLDTFTALVENFVLMVPSTADESTVSAAGAGLALVAVSPLSSLPQPAVGNATTAARATANARACRRGI